jgi:hypothetical protein
VSCSFTTAGRTVKPRTSAFVGRRAVCVFGVPVGTKGQRFRSSLSGTIGWLREPSGVDGEPDAGRLRARPLDPMAHPRRDERVISAPKRDAGTVGERELGVALHDDHPLVPVLLEPLPGGSGMPARDDSLDEHVLSAREPLEELVRGKLTRELEEVHRSGCRDLRGERRDRER